MSLSISSYLMLTVSKRSEAAVLTCRLENGQLIDQDGRLAYIASNHQYVELSYLMGVPLISS